MEKINFYFDYLSPFSYLAWEKLKKLSLPEINYIPVAMGSLFNHWGIKGPGEIQPKREYLLKVCLRIAKDNNIPFTTPPVHPFNPLYALRMSLKSVTGEKQFEVIDSIWKMGWQDRLDISDPDLLTNKLGTELYEKAFSKEAKAELKQNTQLAIENGVFGVPTFTFNQELFWGQDSLIDLVKWTKNENGYDSVFLKELLASTPRGN